MRSAEWIRTDIVTAAKEGINGKLALTIKSGKYHLGYKSVLKTLRSGKGKFSMESLR